MNPFRVQQAPTFVNSGPNSFIDFGQYEDVYGQQQQQLQQQQGSYRQETPPPVIPPKSRTPVMGTRTYHHRRTLSNVSPSQYSNRGYPLGYIIDDDSPHHSSLDYRFNNLNIVGNREPLQFHSVPYSCNNSDSSNVHQIPDRMRLYENVSHFQHHLQQHQQQQSSSLPVSQNQTPIKSPPQQQQQHQHQFIKTSSITNSERRQMFFNSEAMDKESEQQVESNVGASKISGSTGCTPTHSTPHDSFSDDSSYLSALSSQNRVRFSPENFLTDTTAAFSPTNRIAVANLQRALVKKTMELEEGEKS